MGRLIDLTGQRFGRLTVIERVGTTNDGKATWSCKCDCENYCVVSGALLRNKHTRSCGCLEKEVKKAGTNKKHGKFYTRLSSIWRDMKKRCYCPNAGNYKHYGARGITICDEWLHNFQAFWDWAMANGYQDDLSIDRIDNDKGYSPDNCRWATQKAQVNNRRSNHYITFAEKTLTITQWQEKQGITKGQYDSRIKRGWTIEEALELVPRTKTK